MVRCSTPRRTIIELTRSCLDVVDKFLRGGRGDRRIDRKRDEYFGDLNNGREIFYWVVRHGVEQTDVLGEGSRGHEQSAAIRRGACGRLRAYVAAGAGLVLDDDRLTQALLQFLGDNACHDVRGIGACRVWNDDRDRAARLLRIDEGQCSNRERYH